MVSVQNSTTEEIASQPLMKIQSNNYQVESNVSLYPDDLKMLIVVLKRCVLATEMFKSFAVPLTWLSMVASTASINKGTDILTFNLVNEKRIRLNKKMFS